MPEDTISRNEFNGFALTVREDFKRFGDQLTVVSGKLDMLVNGRIEEARVLGEITGSIKSINERMERLESRMETIEGQQAESRTGKIKWFGQFILVVVAAVIGYFASRIK